MSQKTRMLNAKPMKGHTHSASSLTPILAADAQNGFLYDVRMARPLAVVLRPKVRASGPLYRSGQLLLVGFEQLEKGSNIRKRKR